MQPRKDPLPEPKHVDILVRHLASKSIREREKQIFKKKMEQFNKVYFINAKQWKCKTTRNMSLENLSFFLIPFFGGNTKLMCPESKEKFTTLH